MKSLSEIETISKRASRAIGFSWGEAEDIAKSVRLLEMFGLPGIKNLNQYYNERVEKNFEKLSSINKDNKSKKFFYCPITLGVSFMDQIKTIESFNKCTFQEIVYPILFLPFISRSSEIIGKKILFKFDKIEFLLNFNTSISSNFLKKEFPSVAKNCEVNFINKFKNVSAYNKCLLSHSECKKELLWNNLSFGTQPHNITIYS